MNYVFALCAWNVSADISVRYISGAFSCGVTVGEGLYTPISRRIEMLNKRCETDRIHLALWARVAGLSLPSTVVLCILGVQAKTSASPARSSEHLTEKESVRCSAHFPGGGVAAPARAFKDG